MAKIQPTTEQQRKNLQSVLEISKVNYKKLLESKQGQRIVKRENRKRMRSVSHANKVLARAKNKGLK